MFEFGDLLTYTGWGIRFVGMFVFGVCIGWFSWRIYSEPEQDWKLQAVAYLGFLLFSAAVIRFMAAGSTGVFLLSAAGTLLFFGLRSEGIFKRKDSADEE